ncbi:Piso0_001622 [Millerozyma farinosa CBS 7064]|uniref:Piso0_001622 protein n=1 Tax=Pichia sorbitophila (strain ATCC MYA-4447 / BCRC 22081 / CBS 7064 / NBRC 10061 / NRRL Y-12695) TaxID=559304 RepID=G8YLA2_PICSO|nr:Piso0_001622 [Millerozyma farinosa CBS 7064]
MTVINNLAFNQDYSCISISTDKYHKIFNCEPFGEFYSSIQSAAPGDITKEGNGPSEGSKDQKSDSKGGENVSPTMCLKMLFSTSLTIIVPQSSSGSNRLLKIYNLKHNMKICELTFPSHILDVKLNRKRLCVVLESGQIYIYDLSCIRLIKVLEIRPFASNDGASGAGSKEFIGALGSDDSSFLVFPLALISDQTDLFNSDPTGTGSGTSTSPSSSFTGNTNSGMKSQSAKLPELDPRSVWELCLELIPDEMLKKGFTSQDLQKNTEGWTIVYDTMNLTPRLIFKAHNSHLAKIAITNDSSIIATASTKGTILRAFHIESGDPGAQEGDDASKPAAAPLRVSKIVNLRRGHNPVRIHSLSFSLDNQVLGCGSERNTLHFFALSDDSGIASKRQDDSSASSDHEEQGKSSEGLNENLANLLISKAPADSSSSSQQPSYRHYLPSIKKMVESNNYTKSLVKNLPYKNYFDNLILEPPRRSFAYIRLPDDPSHKNMSAHTSNKNKVELGLVSKSKTDLLILVASYKSGLFHQYALPKIPSQEEHAESRHSCPHIATYSLV